MYYVLQFVNFDFLNNLLNLVLVEYFEPLQLV